VGFEEGVDVEEAEELSVGLLVDVEEVEGVIEGEDVVDREAGGDRVFTELPRVPRGVTLVEAVEVGEAVGCCRPAEGVKANVGAPTVNVG